MIVPKIEIPIPKVTKIQFFTFHNVDSSWTALSSKAGVIIDRVDIQIAPERLINRSKSGTKRAIPSKLGEINHE